MNLKVILDCDDVLVNFMDTIVKAYNKFYGTDYVTERDVTDWEIDEEKFSEGIWSVFDKDPELISKMPIKDKKIPKILRKLKKRGCEFVVVTGTKRESELQQKKELLKSYGIDEYIDDVIATRCKHVVSANVIIDDHVEYLEEYRKYHPFAYCLLMDAPHNRGKGEEFTRVRNWSEVEFALNEICDYFEKLN